MKVLIFAELGVTLLWVAQRIILPEPPTLTYKIVLAVHAMLVLALLILNIRASRVSVGLLIAGLFAFIPITAPFATSLLWAFLFQSRSYDAPPEQAALFHSLRLKWLARGCVGVAMAVVAGDVLLTPVFNGTATNFFPIFADPLARGRNSLETPSKLVFAVFVLVYGRWSITSASAL